MIFCFLPVSPFGIRKFSNFPDFFGDCFACLYLFNSFISEFAHLWWLWRKEATRQPAPVSGILCLCIFCIFCNSEFARVWRRGSTEATRQAGRMSGKSTTRTVWLGPPSRTIFPTHFDSTSSSSSTHLTSSSSSSSALLSCPWHSNQVFIGQ